MQLSDYALDFVLPISSSEPFEKWFLPLLRITWPRQFSHAKPEALAEEWGAEFLRLLREELGPA